jgi:hypothetical protein
MVILTSAFPESERRPRDQPHITLQTSEGTLVDVIDSPEATSLTVGSERPWAIIGRSWRRSSSKAGVAAGVVVYDPMANARV